MYTLVLIAALAQGAEISSAGDLPGDDAMTPPGAASPVGGETAAHALPKSNGGFFSRLFRGRAKDAPLPPPAAVSAPPPTPPDLTVAAPASPASPKRGFFYNLFHSTDYDQDFDKEKKWEHSMMNNPD